MSDDVILKTIQGWKWFAYVPLEAQQWLAAQATVRQIPKGQLIYSPGDPVQHVFGVISGAFRIYFTSPRGDELIMEEVVAGGWFSHYTPDVGAKHVLHCKCQQAASVVAVPHSTLEVFAERWPKYYKGLYAEFTARAVAVFARLELLSLHNLDVRMAVYLLRMARLRGRAEADGSVWIPNDESQEELGTRVGATRQHVNGLLKTWTRRGIVAVAKGELHLIDMAALREEATKSGFDIDGYLGAWHYGWQGSR